MKLAISRQAVAEWRDRQILAAAALLNEKSIDARAAFDREIETATAAETIFNASALANARIDALLCTSVGESLPDFLGMAGQELISIDPSLNAISDALRRADIIVLPLASAPLHASTVVDATSSVVSDSEQTQPQKRGIAGMSAMLVKRASSLADGAGNAADELLQDKLGLKNRLRTAAADRIARNWMGGTGEPKSVLAQLVALIEETTHAARMRLS